MQFNRQFGDERDGRVKSSESAFSRSSGEQEEAEEEEEDDDNIELLAEDVLGTSSTKGGRKQGHYTSLQKSSQVRNCERNKSQPMDVPEWRKKRGGNGRNDDDEDDDEDGDGDDIVPPHLMAAREHAGRDMASFSVIEGHGRTLKGIDQRNVRNAVWRSTGFAD